jgi:hypothetical protein
LRTTSLLIDDDILIDAGTGVSELSLQEMMRIRHVFVTHTHLDHIACLPLMIDSLFPHISAPLLDPRPALDDRGPQETHLQLVDLAGLRAPAVRGGAGHALPGSRTRQVCIVGGRSFEMIPVNHIVPTVGYRIACGSSVVAFSGDTTTNDTFWDALNAGERLDTLIVEVAFTDSFRELSLQSRHYCPVAARRRPPQTPPRPGDLSHPQQAGRRDDDLRAMHAADHRSPLAPPERRHDHRSLNVLTDPAAGLFAA